MASVTVWLQIIIVAGLAGAIGQGARVVVGLKKLNDAAAATSPGLPQVFDPSRLWVSLLIGFIAGVFAALALHPDFANLSAQTIIAFAAAGYAGTDFIEGMMSRFLPSGHGSGPAAVVPVQPSGSSTTSTPVTPDTTANQSLSLESASLLTTLTALNAQAGVFNAKYGVWFASLVSGGFFSSNPDDLSVPRAIRANNPGALNISPWQESRKGFVAITQPDGAGNRTTIYRTPEHGVASWFYLLSNRYGFGQGGSFTLTELAVRYAGAPSSDDPSVRAYLQGWQHWSGGQLQADTEIQLADDDKMLSLAHGMFSHEAGRQTPLQDEQIMFGVRAERAGTLPT